MPISHTHSTHQSPGTPPSTPSYISRQNRDDYLAQMSEIIDDTTLPAHGVAKDLYHLSNNVLIPKFRWHRIAYASFVASLLLSIVLLLYNLVRASS
ncbi:hypothetical protein VDG1235_1081 [Verrucomicrobiia bacterium DG1235]|nr:hypothetical protein VDG1235_1081 [Verrucomicrobiae bacterium DG1235]